MQLEGANFLNLREVQVFDQSAINRALNKPASQSSTYWMPGVASKAVNGDLNDSTHTNFDDGKYHIDQCKFLMCISFINLTFSFTLSDKVPGGRWISERVLQWQE